MLLGDGAVLRHRGAQRRNRSNDKAIQRGCRQMAQAYKRTEDEDIISSPLLPYYRLRLLLLVLCSLRRRSVEKRKPSEKENFLCKILKGGNGRKSVLIRRSECLYGWERERTETKEEDEEEANETSQVLLAFNPTNCNLVPKYLKGERLHAVVPWSLLKRWGNVLKEFQLFNMKWLYVVEMAEDV
ncbi:hypothetical protein PIB30_033109 [Stylosanthes scabra]|uniref:Uncharacterized protein n=1 Tax=Stylosanthes scabra TaxID=79078 RepID=A0ABU6TD48_9FABA|nr:hypothetical protein [Stylosanthes scabra]